MGENCEACKFYCNMLVFDRKVGSIGGLGYVSGWKVNIDCNGFSESTGCTKFLSSDNIVFETLPQDMCESFEAKK